MQRRNRRHKSEDPYSNDNSPTRVVAHTNQHRQSSPAVPGTKTVT